LLCMTLIYSLLIAHLPGIAGKHLSVLSAGLFSSKTRTFSSSCVFSAE
jgi:hypothetical protein